MTSVFVKHVNDLITVAQGGEGRRSEERGRERREPTSNEGVMGRRGKEKSGIAYMCERCQQKCYCSLRWFRG